MMDVVGIDRWPTEGTTWLSYLRGASLKIATDMPRVTPALSLAPSDHICSGKPLQSFERSTEALNGEATN